MEFSVSEHAFLYVICRHEMNTVCRPSDRDVNWRSLEQGKSHHLQVKDLYGSSNWLLVGLYPVARGVKCTPSVSSYEV